MLSLHKNLHTRSVGCEMPASYFIPFETESDAANGDRNGSMRFRTLCGTWRFRYFDSVDRFSDRAQYSFDTIDGIDLVVKDTNGKYLSPLEVKLTVLPTDNTSHKPEDEWGCELVIRSATTSYCALGMFDSVKEHSRHVREIFEPTCSKIQMWDNDFEMTHKTPLLFESINKFLCETYENREVLQNAMASLENG